MSDSEKRLEILKQIDAGMKKDREALEEAKRAAAADEAPPKPQTSEGDVDDERKEEDSGKEIMSQEEVDDLIAYFSGGELNDEEGDEEVSSGKEIMSQEEADDLIEVLRKSLKDDQLEQDEKRSADESPVAPDADTSADRRPLPDADGSTTTEPSGDGAGFLSEDKPSQGSKLVEEEKEKGKAKVWFAGIREKLPSWVPGSKKEKERKSETVKLKMSGETVVLPLGELMEQAGIKWEEERRKIVDLAELIGRQLEAIGAEVAQQARNLSEIRDLDEVVYDQLRSESISGTIPSQVFDFVEGREDAKKEFLDHTLKYIFDEINRIFTVNDYGRIYGSLSGLTTDLRQRRQEFLQANKELVVRLDQLKKTQTGKGYEPTEPRDGPDPEDPILKLVEGRGKRKRELRGRVEEIKRNLVWILEQGEEAERGSQIGPACLREEFTRLKLAAEVKVYEIQEGTKGILEGREKHAQKLEKLAEINSDLNDFRRDDAGKLNELAEKLMEWREAKTRIKNLKDRVVLLGVLQVPQLFEELGGRHKAGLESFKEEMKAFLHAQKDPDHQDFSEEMEALKQIEANLEIKLTDLLEQEKDLRQKAEESLEKKKGLPALRGSVYLAAGDVWRLAKDLDEHVLERVGLSSEEVMELLLEMQRGEDDEELKGLEEVSREEGRLRNRLEELEELKQKVEEEVGVELKSWAKQVRVARYRIAKKSEEVFDRLEEIRASRDGELPSEFSHLEEEATTNKEFFPDQTDARVEECFENQDIKSLRDYVVDLHVQYEEIKYGLEEIERSQEPGIRFGESEVGKISGFKVGQKIGELELTEFAAEGAGPSGEKRPEFWVRNTEKEENNLGTANLEQLMDKEAAELEGKETGEMFDFRVGDKIGEFELVEFIPEGVNPLVEVKPEFRVRNTGEEGGNLIVANLEQLMTLARQDAADLEKEAEDKLDDIRQKIGELEVDLPREAKEAFAKNKAEFLFVREKFIRLTTSKNINEKVSALKEYLSELDRFLTLDWTSEVERGGGPSINVNLDGKECAFRVGDVYVNWELYDYNEKEGSFTMRHEKQGEKILSHEGMLALLRGELRFEDKMLGGAWRNVAQLRKEILKLQLERGEGVITAVTVDIEEENKQLAGLVNEYFRFKEEEKNKLLNERVLYVKNFASRAEALEQSLETKLQELKAVIETETAESEGDNPELEGEEILELPLHDPETGRDFIVKVGESYQDGIVLDGTVDDGKIKPTQRFEVLGIVEEAAVSAGGDKRWVFKVKNERTVTELTIEKKSMLSVLKKDRLYQKQEEEKVEEANIMDSDTGEDFVIKVDEEYEEVEMFEGEAVASGTKWKVKSIYREGADTPEEQHLFLVESKFLDGDEEVTEEVIMSKEEMITAVKGARLIEKPVDLEGESIEEANFIINGRQTKVELNQDYYYFFEKNIYLSKVIEIRERKIGEEQTPKFKFKIRDEITYEEKWYEELDMLDIVGNDNSIRGMSDELRKSLIENMERKEVGEGSFRMGLKRYHVRPGQEYTFVNPDIRIEQTWKVLEIHRVENHDIRYNLLARDPKSFFQFHLKEDHTGKEEWIDEYELPKLLKRSRQS